MSKIQHLEDLSTAVGTYRKKGKKVVLCHGVFDLLHPGHILYFQAAKKHGDILIVTVTPDEYVNKGPGRPVFNERLRMESIAALECVDHVALNKWPTAVKTIKALKPNVYAKGQDYANAMSDLTGQIRNEMNAVKQGGGKVVFTNEEMFSSSSLLNKFFSPFSASTNKYLQEFRKKHSVESVIKSLEQFSKLRVLIIGEAIMDQYCYCLPMAKSPKETIVASRFVSDEHFAGGSVAIANHLGGFCKNVSLVTALGKEAQSLQFFKRKLHKGVQMHPVFMDDRPTIVKRRYVEPNFMTKMFEIQYLEDSYIPESLERQVLEKLRNLLPKHDLVIVADYGHGFLTDRIRDEISALSKFLCVNTQTNSANYGFNVATKYHKLNYVSIDEPEMKLALRNKYGHVPDMATHLRRQIEVDTLLVSRGPNGSVVVSDNDKLTETPIFSSRVVDRTGAGDALFALTSPCVYLNLAPEVIGFIGSCAGAMKVATVCNRDPIEPVSLYKFITAVLK